MVDRTECDDSECPSPELKSERLDDDVFHNPAATEKSKKPLISHSEEIGYVFPWKIESWKNGDLNFNIEILSGGHGHSHGHGGHGHSHGGIAMVGWMVILGDALHNFADGLGELIFGIFTFTLMRPYELKN